MVRATAVSLLSNVGSGESIATLDTLWQAKDGHPLLRLGVTAGAAALSPQRLWQIVSPLLEDEHLAVRSAAFSALLPMASDPELGPLLRAHLPAFLDAHSQNLDWPETQVNLANAHVAFGDAVTAEFALREALVLQPSFVPAMLNLADLYRATKRDEDGEELLVRAMQTVPDTAAPVFGYAMWLARQQRSATALEYFQRAAGLEPDHLRYNYAFAVALNDSGRGTDAVEKLDSMLERWPGNPDLLYALALMLRDQGRNEEAVQRLDQLLEIVPENRSLQELRKQLGNQQ
jgi:tetratricopeptide (TPR) repeat protein